MKIITDLNLKKDLQEWANNVIVRIKAEMNAQNTVASGNLSNSLSYEITDESDGTHIKILAANYFPYSEFGRTSGRIPRGFGEILERWIEAKGISVPSGFKDAKQFGWAIASKIRKYGSKRRRENNPADVVGPALDKELPVLNEMVGNRVVYYVNEYFFDEI